MSDARPRHELVDVDFPFPPFVADLRDGPRNATQRSGPRPSRRHGPSRARRAERVSFEEWGAGAAVVVGEPRREQAAPVDVPVVTAPVVRADGAVDEDQQLRGRAAEHLERVAHRVRAGELRPLGLRMHMTEAGALAATLAALLAPQP